jgi:hypothetical protein
MPSGLRRPAVGSATFARAAGDLAKIAQPQWPLLYPQVRQPTLGVKGLRRLNSL